MADSSESQRPPVKGSMLIKKKKDKEKYTKKIKQKNKQKRAMRLSDVGLRDTLCD